MAWNIKTTSDENAIHTIFTLLTQCELDDWNKDNIKFMIGGLADSRIYKYASKKAYKKIKKEYPECFLENGFKIPNKSDFTVEHTIPNEFVYKYLFKLTEEGKISKQIITKILGKLVCTIICTDENKKLNETYKSTMPEDWSFNDNQFERYTQTEIDIVDYNGNVMNAI